MKKLKESVTECNEALKLDDSYLKAILRRAACYMELQEFEEAVRDYEKACKIDKNRGKLHRTKKLYIAHKFRLALACKNYAFS